MTRRMTFRGVVVDADDRRRTVAGAQVYVDMNGVAQTVTSCADGRFSVEVRVYYRGDAPEKPTKISRDAPRPVWNPFDILVPSSRRISIIPRGDWSATLPER